MKMTELYHEYTVTIIDGEDGPDLRADAYGLIRRMRDKNLIADIKKTNEITGLGNAKRYGLLMDPVQFLRQRNGSKTNRIATTSRLFQQPVQLKKCKGLEI
jgi:hypothetical protein